MDFRLQTRSGIPLHRNSRSLYLLSGQSVDSPTVHLHRAIVYYSIVRYLVSKYFPSLNYFYTLAHGSISLIPRQNVYPVLRYFISIQIQSQLSIYGLINRKFDGKSSTNVVLENTSKYVLNQTRQCQHPKLTYGVLGKTNRCIDYYLGRGMCMLI